MSLKGITLVAGAVAGGLGLASLVTNSLTPISHHTREESTPAQVAQWDYEPAARLSPDWGRVSEPKIWRVDLSNGMTIHAGIKRVETFETGKKYIVETGYRDMEIFDLGDGKPYVWQEEGYVLYDNDGKIEEDTRKMVKRFKLTYHFEGTDYPIWEPTAFRTNPNYGIPASALEKKK